MILEKTVELVKKIYKYHKIVPPKITKVIIGLGYTGVEATAYSYEPFLGLVYTLPSVIKKTDCNKISFAGSLTDKSLLEVLQWSYEPLSLKKIVGIATLNAVSQHIFQIAKDNDWGNPYIRIKESLIDYLKIVKNTRVTIIGFIKPMIQQISKITQNIIIIEDNPSISSNFNNFVIRNDINQLDEKELSTDILFCTGTALVNDTFEEILKFFKRNVRCISIIGPSVSMLPDILFDYGVDIVGGMKVIDSESTLKIIQEGGGTKLFKKFGIKYNLIPK
ncbi:MAG: Rossmann-like domain-containing protein [Candidatus Hodarchaeota archaeon]